MVSSRQSDRNPAEALDESEASDRLVLIENLMLQRIAESVRSDNSDDRWILTGTMTEYFGENRMVIETAQRSNAE